VSENRLPRRAFAPKREKVIGIRKKLYNEELHNSYPRRIFIMLDKSGGIRRSWLIGNVGKKIKVYKIFGRKI
jgi:hypothetical protein